MIVGLVSWRARRHLSLRYAVRHAVRYAIISSTSSGAVVEAHSGCVSRTMLFPFPSPSPSPSENGAGNGAASGTETPPYRPRYIDIGINLADPVFRGVYNGKQRHQDDLDRVLDRARHVGCTKLIVTGSSSGSSRDAITIARASPPGFIFTTAGIHPCCSSVFASANPHSHREEEVVEVVDADKTDTIISDLRSLVEASRAPGPVVAFGEFGLDYDRLHYCSKPVQLHSFRSQLALAASLTPQLPLFLHSRAAHEDFVACLKAAFGDGLERLERGGVVHSFTGTVQEMTELMDLGLHIGLNGCSFKTAENCQVAKAVRLDRLMIETDGPWCEVRPSHEGWKYLVEAERKEMAAAVPAAKTDVAAAENEEEKAVPPVHQRPKPKTQLLSKEANKKKGEVLETFQAVKKEKWVEGAMVKGRNEPCMIERVVKIIANIKDVSVAEVCECAWDNTVKVFGLGDTLGDT